jgi:23S rRNA (cytidine2498-2'-O)-methyltransferase
MTPPLVQDSLASSSQNSSEDFVFLACQRGTEPTIKKNYHQNTGPLRLAFSRPGLLTLKVDRSGPAESFQLPQHPLVRQSGWVVGQLKGDSASQMVREALALARFPVLSVHVFQRDSLMPGARGTEPGKSVLVEEIANIIREQTGGSVPVNQTARSGQQVLDLIVAEPNQWIVGYHWADERDPLSQWPGGVLNVSQPPGMISRAYLKMAEAIMWSRLPISSGDSIVEIGCAPGGSCQRLLDMGLKVTGVDPAEMDPVLLKHPEFTHWRSKAAAVKRKRYQRFRWLTADANVAPNYTLDFVEDIVQYPTTRLEGLLLTLKLSTYDLIDHLPAYINRVKGWGFQRVEARQLAHNRRELFLVAHRKNRTPPA